jgi:hypothetical protein
MMDFNIFYLFFATIYFEIGEEREGLFFCPPIICQKSKSPLGFKRALI